MAYEEICPNCGAVMVLNEVAMKKRLESMATHLITGVNPRPKARFLAKDETVEIDVCVKRRTEKAILVEVENLDEDLWIPKSQIEDWDENISNKDIDSILIPNWLAQEKGLIST